MSNWQGQTYKADCLSPKETWDIFDSTKVKAFQECPRRFFYNYVLGWSKEEGNIHLDFGGAFHEGMEVIVKALKSGRPHDDILAEACIAFDRFFDRVYPNEALHSDFSPKDPKHAYMAYETYLEHYIDEDITCLHTELPGVVAVSPDHHIHFKMDGVGEAGDGHPSYHGVVALEHKTGSRNSLVWREGWHLALQPTVYTHALNCLYGIENVDYVVINGVFLYKDKIGLERVPVKKNLEQMREWIWEIQHTFHVIDHNMEALTQADTGEPFLRCFPKNTGACTDWGRICPYADFCMAGKNPLHFADEPPYGFHEKHWNPQKEHENAKETLVVEEGKAEIVVSGVQADNG